MQSGKQTADNQAQKMCSVVLIRPLGAVLDLELQEPLFIERLSGYLIQEGCNPPMILDRRLYQKERQTGIDESDALGFWDMVTAGFSKGGRPRLVNLIVDSADDIPDAVSLARQLLPLCPHTRYVASGRFVASHKEEARRLFPDKVELLSFEGERVLLQLVKAIEGRRRKKTDVSPLLPDEWAIPYRPYLERYVSLGCTVDVQSSLSCSGKQKDGIFAAFTLPGEHDAWRGRSISLIVDEMEDVASRLVAAGLPPVFNFIDDDFGPLSRVEELVQELFDRHLRVAFSIRMGMAQLVGEKSLAERLVALRESGLVQLFLDTYSLNVETLQKWGRRYDVRCVPSVIDACQEAGIFVQVDYSLWHQDATIDGVRTEALRLHRMGIFNHRLAKGGTLVASQRRFDLEEEPGSVDEEPQCNQAESRSRHLPSELEELYYRFDEHSWKLDEVWIRAMKLRLTLASKAFLDGAETLLGEANSVIAACNEFSYRVFVLEDRMFGFDDLVGVLSRRVSWLEEQLSLQQT